MLEKEDIVAAETRIKAVLSGLEWDVFRLYVQRKSYLEIAEALGRTEKSVDNAIYRIKNKLKRLI